MRNDTLKKRLVHVSGQLSSEALLSNRKLPYQSVPASCLRVIFQPAVDFGIIPLRGSFMLTTEQFGINHSLNNYSFGFDYALFTGRLHQQITDKKRIEDSLSATDSLIQAYRQYATRYRLIKMQLSNPRYLADIERSRRIILTDSLGDGQKNLQLRNARLKLTEHLAMQNELAEIETKLPLLENYSRNKRVEHLTENFKTPSLTKNLKAYGLQKPGYSSLLAIKRFDIGNTAPDYSELTIRGTSLTGVNIEYNPGNFYTAFAYGKTVTAFMNPFANSFRSGRKLMAARIGYGKKEGTLVCATLLKGWDGKGANVSDSNFTYYEPQANTVLSLQGRWRWKEYLLLEGEYAGSINTTRNQQTEHTGQEKRRSGISQTVSDAFGQNGHQAFYTKVSSSISETGTELMLAWRQVQAQYYTFGNPFLRPDNKRVEGKASQKLWSNQVKLTASFRRDEDNTLFQKQVTTITNIYSYVADFHFRNKPFVIFTYTPSLQYYKGTERSNQYISRTRVYISTTGYTYKIRRITYSTVVVNSIQRIDSKIVNWNHRMWTHALSQQVFFKNGVALNASFTLIYNTGRTDSVLSLNAETGASWTVKQKYQLSSGVIYQHDRYLQERGGIYAGLSFAWGKTGRVDLRMEEHLVDERRSSTSYAQTLMRLRITKKF